MAAQSGKSGRIALGISYDGSWWHGWQTQPDGETVQDTVEGALSRFLDHPVKTICAGRTDAGVHALGQVVHVDTPAYRREESWVRGLNALLPRGISVLWAKPVSEQFHARFSAMARTYIYVLRSARVRSPLTQGRIAWVHYPLDLARMRAAAGRLLGKHDFSSFRSAECQAASPVRTLITVDIQQDGEHFFFTFRANAFLHHMVRNLMGALIYVGIGRQPPEWVTALLADRDRRRAPPTFCPDGLYLAQVDYPGEFGLPVGRADEMLASLLGLRPPARG